MVRFTETCRAENRYIHHLFRECDEIDYLLFVVIKGQPYIAVHFNKRGKRIVNMNLAKDNEIELDTANEAWVPLIATAAACAGVDGVATNLELKATEVCLHVLWEFKNDTFKTNKIEIRKSATVRSIRILQCVRVRAVC